MPDDLDEAEDLSRLIGVFYDAALDPDLWGRALELTCSYVNAVAASLFWQDPVTKSAQIFHSWGEDPAFQAAYVNTYVRLNPLLPAMSFIEPGIAFSAGDLIPHEQFAETRFFQEWVAPQGLIDAMAINLQHFSTSAASLTMQRSRDQGLVDQKMRRRVALLVPHVRRAVLIGREIDRQKARSETLEKVLSGVSAGVFLPDATGRLSFVNDVGRALLDRGDILGERDGMLRAMDRGADQALRAALAATARPDDLSLQGSAPSIALPGPEGERYLAHVLPLSSGARMKASLGYSATAAVFVRKAEIPIVSGIEAVARIYALTPSEIRVLQAAVTKGAVGEMATALGMSIGTVKTHLSSVFVKTGARRRSDLVREVAAHGSILT